MINSILEGLRMVALLVALGQPAQIEQYKDGTTIIVMCEQSEPCQQRPDHATYVMQGQKVEITRK